VAYVRVGHQLALISLIARNSLIKLAVIFTNERIMFFADSANPVSIRQFSVHQLATLFSFTYRGIRVFNGHIAMFNWFYKHCNTSS
jgi:hypothetical protein